MFFLSRLELLKNTTPYSSCRIERIAPGDGGGRLADHLRHLPRVRHDAAANLGGRSLRSDSAQHPCRPHRLEDAQRALLLLRLEPAGRQCHNVRRRQRGRSRRQRDDGARPAARLPRYAQLHCRPPGDGGREREAGAPAAERAAAARRHGDEERHSVAGEDAIPQDLHPEARERQHSVCGHRRLYGAGVAVQRPGAGAPAERAVRAVRSAGQRSSLLAHQDSGRLLLLCVRFAGSAGGSCNVRGGNGPGHDRCNCVSVWGWVL